MLVEELERELAARRTIPDKAGRDLACFVRQAWPVIEPGAPTAQLAHRADLRVLEAVSAGQINRLIINMPPRYGKSHLGQRAVAGLGVDQPSRAALPVLQLLGQPLGQALAGPPAGVESEWYRACWPQVALTRPKPEEPSTKTRARGVMFATSVGGTVTGKGGNRIILDDPIDPDQASSETERSSANGFFDQTLSTRLDDKKRDAIVIVGQRVHLDDLSGHVLERSAEAGRHLQAAGHRGETHRGYLSGQRAGVIREPGRAPLGGREARRAGPGRRELGSADMPPSTSRTRHRPRGR